jgi:hypothetical protein
MVVSHPPTLAPPPHPLFAARLAATPSPGGESIGSPLSPHPMPTPSPAGSTGAGAASVTPVPFAARAWLPMDRASDAPARRADAAAAAAAAAAASDASAATGTVITLDANPLKVTGAGRAFCVGRGQRAEHFPCPVRHPGRVWLR